MRLFRGFAHMTQDSLSEPSRGYLLRIMERFLRSEMAAREIEPTMWISVIDIAQKLNLHELGTYAQAMFYKKFAWHTLHTSYDAK